MTSTRDNPGAFNVRTTRTFATIARKALGKLRRRDFSSATLGVFTDSLNLLESTTSKWRDKRFRCSCCGYEAHAFLHVLSGRRVVWNSACPGCNSRSRHRGLAILLPRLLDEHSPETILHFAPEPVLRRVFASRDVRYETADLFLDDATHTSVDLQAPPFPDASYDFVVCNHVLEHVADDSAAIASLRRILSPSGVAVITVPGDFRRAETTYFHGELPNGHYRDYGLDLVRRLESVFRNVEMIDLHTFDREGTLSHAIRPLDVAFVCEV